MQFTFEIIQQSIYNFYKFCFNTIERLQYITVESANTHKVFESIRALHPTLTQLKTKYCYSVVKFLNFVPFSGLDTLSMAFNLCRPMTAADEVNHMYGWIRNSLSTMAMLDYPYPTELFGHLPANPVNVSTHADPWVPMSTNQAVLSLFQDCIPSCLVLQSLGSYHPLSALDNFLNLSKDACTCHRKA